MRFSTCQFYRSKPCITRPSNFRKFLQTAEECCDRNICRTFCKLGSLIKSNFDRFLYKCQISDSLFDVPFPTFQFYLLTCEITKAPNFQTVMQTSEEFCNKNIPVVFTTSTNNGVCRGGLAFLTDDFATYKIDSLTFCEEVLTFLSSIC